MKKKAILSFILIFTVALSGCSWNGAADKKQHRNRTNQAERNSPLKNLKNTKKNKPDLGSQPVNTTGWVDVKRPAHIPILMYHSISTGNSLRVPEEKFTEQMKWLKDHGYYTLSPEEAYVVLTQDRKPRRKCILITLDDGYTDNFRKAFPILKKNDMKATIFMIGSAIGAKNHLTKQQMAKMHQNGISIESHTIDHLELPQLSPERQRKEMVNSKQLLDRLSQQQTTILSYPAGRYNDDTLRLAKQTGYKMAVTTKPGSASRVQGLYTLHRIRITPDMSIQGFSRIVDHANASG